MIHFPLALISHCQPKTLLGTTMAESSISSSVPITTGSPSISKLQELLSRVEGLERKRYSKSCSDRGITDAAVVPHIMDASMRRARFAVETQTTLHYSAVWKFVPEHYYETSLEERARCLQAPSIHYLCKSLLLENRKATTTCPYDPTNPRFVLVVIQYASILDAKKLITTIRQLRTDVTQRLDVSQFDFRIATESNNETITGYAHNSVTPFGMKCQQRQQKITSDDDSHATNIPVPIILSASLRPLHWLWLGGGHVHLKLGLSVSDFLHAFRHNLIVADISRPRISTGIGHDDDDDDME